MATKELNMGMPNPRQAEFFSAKGRHICYGGARGGGKSFAMRWKLIILALHYPGLKCLLLRRTFPELRENHINPMLLDLHDIAKWKESEKVFIFPNGSRIKLGYCENEGDANQYQGQEYDVIGFEEATAFSEAQLVFIATCLRSTRTDFKPRIYYTANPGGPGHQYIKRLFIDCEYQGKENPDDYVFIPASVYDNTVLMEANPEYVQLLENLPEDLRRAHLEGDWNVFAGQYFREFSKEIHVCRAFKIPEHWRRFRGFDYGLDMTACYWCAVDEGGKLYVYRELYESDLTLTQAAERIQTMTPLEEKIDYTVAPPDLWNRRQETGYSGAEIMSSAGLIDLMRADNARIPGWRALKEWFLPFEDPNDDNRLTAKIQIFPGCKNLIRCIPLLQHSQYDPDDVGDTNHEVTHAPDALRYIVQSRPRMSKGLISAVPRDVQRVRDHIEQMNRRKKKNFKRHTV